MPESPNEDAAASCRELALLLIRPSKYDDRGYVIRHWRGVLPSNTLNCLHALTLDAVRRGALDGIRVSVHVRDEAVHRVRPERLARKLLRPGVRGLVALAGVQTNQFPRAGDLALRFRRAGFAVMIGGFHVSGAAAVSAELPPECRTLVDAGVTLVLGEVEEAWPGLLRDAAAGVLRPVYNLLGQLPALGHQPVPVPSPSLQRRFAVRGTGTIDTSRGCPFRCSFCTIISVQGRTMRARDPERVLQRIRASARRARQPIRHYFFTDDNFSRNPAWEPIFDGLIAMREQEGLAIDFMMQVDIAAWRIPRFAEKAARAGCVQVFIGLESIREDNLASAGKRQNRVDTYRSAIACWHRLGVVCHVGYIIGFPHDTYARVMQDVRALRDELQVDQASFFMLTPLPGSQDHTSAVAAGVPLDPDYNNYDSFHATWPHPRMSARQWTRAYRDAWREFYAPGHLERALLRQNPHTYWGLFKVYLWYRAAMREGAHPMVTGFFRLRRRLDRRPSLPLEPRLRFWGRRLAEIAATVRATISLALEMQELWLRTRIVRREYRGWPGLHRFRTRKGTPPAIKVAWHHAHARLARLAGDAVESRTLPEASPVLLRRLAVIAADAESGDAPVPELPPGRVPRQLADVRRALTAYWRETFARARRMQLWRVNPLKVAWGLAWEARLSGTFLIALVTERY